MFYETHDSPIRVRYGKSFDFPPHAHHMLEMTICAEGEICVQSRFKEMTLKRGEAMIAFPNDVHAYVEKEGTKIFMILVSPDLLPLLPLENEKTRYDSFLLEPSVDLLPLAEALLAEYRGDGDMSVMIGYLYLILGQSLRMLPKREIALSIESSLLSRILRYVSENYTQKLSLRSISERFGISDCHLSRCFREHLGITFLSYLHTLRVEHAKNLLKHSQRSILEIAYDSGFSDQRTFNRVFLEHTRQTPSEYRASRTTKQYK